MEKINYSTCNWQRGEGEEEQNALSNVIAWLAFFMLKHFSRVPSSFVRHTLYYLYNSNFCLACWAILLFFSLFSRSLFRRSTSLLPRSSTDMTRDVMCRQKLQNERHYVLPVSVREKRKQDSPDFMRFTSFVCRMIVCFYSFHTQLLYINFTHWHVCT